MRKVLVVLVVMAAYDGWEQADREKATQLALPQLPHLAAAWFASIQQLSERQREPELTAMQSKFSSDCYRFCSLRTSANACTLLVFATDWSHSLGAHCTKAMELKMKKVCSKGLVHLLSLPAHYLGLHL